MRLLVRTSPRLAIASALLLLFVAGCGEVGYLARRYKAEQLTWEASRAEAAMRLAQAEPDSAELMRLREQYQRVAKEIPPPYIRGSSPQDSLLAVQVQRLVGTAELQAARLALQANRPDLAIADMKRIATMAGPDTLLRRRADFFLAGTYRQLGKVEEAVALMRDMLKRYPPIPPSQPDAEDAILSVPETMVLLRRQAGDADGARRALNEAATYYEGLLARPNPPLLEAQIRARLVRVELEAGDWSSGFGQLDLLQALVARVPSLKMLEPEIRYSEAKLTAMRSGDKNPAGAVAMFDRFAKEYPKSPFAARALFEAGALLERHGRKREALERYRTASSNYADNPEVAPLALFRRAMLEEQLGDWERAKNLLESIPARYPESAAAVEAPLAVAARYGRRGDREGVRQALRRAIGTYRDLVVRDTTSSYVPIYYWSILRCHVNLEDWEAAMATVDALAGRYSGHPVVAQALLEGARIAHQHGRDDRARSYLERFLAVYPNSPLVADVRRELRELHPRPPRSGSAPS